LRRGTRWNSGIIHVMTDWAYIREITLSRDPKSVRQGELNSVSHARRIRTGNVFFPYNKLSLAVSPDSKLNSILTSYEAEKRWLPSSSLLLYNYKFSQTTCFACCLLSRWAYSSNLKMEATFSSETSVKFQRTSRDHISEDRPHRYGSALPLYDVKWNAWLSCEFMICSVGNRRWRWTGQYTWCQRTQDPPPAISWMKGEAHFHGWVVSVGISARYVTHINNNNSTADDPIFKRVYWMNFRTLVHFILRNISESKCEIVHGIKEPFLICKMFPNGCLTKVVLVPVDVRESGGKTPQILNSSFRLRLVNPRDRATSSHWIGWVDRAKKKKGIPAENGNQVGFI
jgi:hypothetical protein